MESQSPTAYFLHTRHFRLIHAGVLQTDACVGPVCYGLAWFRFAAKAAPSRGNIEFRVFFFFQYFFAVFLFSYIWHVLGICIACIDYWQLRAQLCFVFVLASLIFLSCFCFFFFFAIFLLYLFFLQFLWCCWRFRFPPLALRQFVMHVPVEYPSTTAALSILPRGPKSASLLKAPRRISLTTVIVCRCMCFFVFHWRVEKGLRSCREPWWGGGTIVNRTDDPHKNLCIYLYLPTTFSPIYYGPPRNSK